MQLAEYLFARVHQAGVRDVLGVPGDFNLTLLDYVVPAGLRWVGTCNELNAAYAADAYSRVRGVSAMITTFGVGELSAINGIAGAFAERAPVISIVGAPSLEIQAERRNMHHTYVDGEYQRFRRMAVEVTVYQAALDDAATAPERIDAAIQHCLFHSRPVYLQLPTDCVTLEVDAARLRTPIPPLPLPSGLKPAMAPAEAAKEILDRLYAASKPLVHVDGETRSLGMTAEVNAFVRATNLPTFCSGFAKGLIDEHVPNFYGLFSAHVGRKDYSEHVAASDLLITFGGHYSMTNTYGFRAVPDAAKAIAFTHQGITIPALGGKPALTIEHISAKEVLRALNDSFDPAHFASHAAAAAAIEPKRTRARQVPTDLDAPITQEGFYPLVNALLKPGDVVLGETGTPSWGARELVFPPSCTYFGATTWLSIGYMLPATLGAALARRSTSAEFRQKHPKQNGADQQQQQPSNGTANGDTNGTNGTTSATGTAAAAEEAGSNDRCVLFMGDGSLQMTVQELSTILHQDLNVIAFVINNGGYTIERCLHGWREPYNDVATWRYAEAPSFFGAPDGPRRDAGWKVHTFRDVHDLLQNPKFTTAQGLRLVEVVMDKEDAPETLMEITSRPPPKE